MSPRAEPSKLFGDALPQPNLPIPTYQFNPAERLRPYPDLRGAKGDITIPPVVSKARG